MKWNCLSSKIYLWTQACLCLLKLYVIRLVFVLCRTLPDLSLNTVCLCEDSLIFDRSAYAYTAEETLGS